LGDTTFYEQPNAINYYTCSLSMSMRVEYHQIRKKDMLLVGLYNKLQP
jgi:hypothetical protein